MNTIQKLYCAAMLVALLCVGAVNVQAQAGTYHLPAITSGTWTSKGVHNKGTSYQVETIVLKISGPLLLMVLRITPNSNWVAVQCFLRQLHWPQSSLEIIMPRFGMVFREIRTAVTVGRRKVCIKECHLIAGIMNRLKPCIGFPQKCRLAAIGWSGAWTGLIVAQSATANTPKITSGAAHPTLQLLH